MVLVVALIAIALAANPDNRVLGLVSYAWADSARHLTCCPVFCDVVAYDT